MAMVLTQVYLEPAQKKALTAKAKASGRKSSDLVREAVDALLLGVNTDELRQLDEASRRAEADIQAMVSTLDQSGQAHREFMAEMARLRAASNGSAV
jgi:Ribbon-helix-helix protein, copG family